MMRSSRLMSVFSRCLQRRCLNDSQHRNISTLNKCKSLKTHLPDFKTNSNYLYRRTYYEAGHIYYRATLGFCIRSRHHRPHYSSIRFCSSHNSSDNPEWDSLGTWQGRIQEPILLQQSIKHGIPIPKISISNVGKESLIGRRMTNEDRISILELAPNLLYFGIFDGHGGAVAADYACLHMDKHINYWLAKEHDLQVVLTRAFEDLENRFARHLHIELKDPVMENTGTTATVGLLRNGNELVVASAGDSRAILCRKGKAMRLTRKHDPEDEAERERIEACNGFITWNQYGRPLVNSVLTMTRSIGDESLKRYGVTAQPETKSVEVKHSKDSMLVMVTDGITSVMTDQELCDSIGQCHDPPSAANFVADQALQFGSDDNSSIIVVPFGRWGSYPDTNHTHKLRWFERSKY
ncbi:protein phosphatase 1K, mitochondrial-like [Asterias rubens]|uniref:protein phosphatase 1K, mitochondrial-like n=1 Tax=Asterias rubens TaxID=7604 RepID=UPI0014554C89|nr:protein phosphatase 1K, mitochondrial-like [Asterias rubens]